MGCSAEDLLDWFLICTCAKSSIFQHTDEREQRNIETFEQRGRFSIYRVFHTFCGKLLAFYFTFCHDTGSGSEIVNPHTEKICPTYVPPAKNESSMFLSKGIFMYKSRIILRAESYLLRAESYVLRADFF